MTLGEAQSGIPPASVALDSTLWYGLLEFWYSLDLQRTVSPSLMLIVDGANAFALICTLYNDPPAPPIAFSEEPVSTTSQPSVTSAFSITETVFPTELTTDEPQSSAQSPTAEGATRPADCPIVLSVRLAV